MNKVTGEREYKVAEVTTGTPEYTCTFLAGSHFLAAQIYSKAVYGLAGIHPFNSQFVSVTDVLTGNKVEFSVEAVVNVTFRIKERGTDQITTQTEDGK